MTSVSELKKKFEHGNFPKSEFEHSKIQENKFNTILVFDQKFQGESRHGCVESVTVTDQRVAGRVTSRDE